MENPGNTKAKSNRWDSTNIKSFLLANEAIDRSQMTSDRIQAASRPHVTANGIRRSDKRLISRVHKNLKQCNTETQARGLKNWLRPTPLVFTQLPPPPRCSRHGDVISRFLPSSAPDVMSRHLITDYAITTQAFVPSPSGLSCQRLKAEGSGPTPEPSLVSCPHRWTWR